MRWDRQTVLPCCISSIADDWWGWDRGAILHIHCSVLLQMRHSGFDASKLTQGFGIEPYVLYSPPMVAIAWYDSNAGCCSCTTSDVSEFVSLTQ